MIIDYLPDRVNNSIDKLDFKKLMEIRIRLNQPIKIVYDNKLCNLLDLNNCNIICKSTYITFIMDKLTDGSIYAFESSISRGFITTSNGHRVGICGKCIYENDKIVSYKTITSLNIRIPNEIENCSIEIYNILFTNNIFNTLIISPPLFGKTTLLKDLTQKINNNFDLNILVLDERGELINLSGENIDVLSNVNKKLAYETGVRNLSPNVIIMDELITDLDVESLKKCIFSGVKVITTCHGNNINNFALRDKIRGIFDYYVVVNKLNQFLIYNKDFTCI